MAGEGVRRAAAGDGSRASRDAQVARVTGTGATVAIPVAIALIGLALIATIAGGPGPASSHRAAAAPASLAIADLAAVEAEGVHTPVAGAALVVVDQPEDSAEVAEAAGTDAPVGPAASGPPGLGAGTSGDEPSGDRARGAAPGVDEGAPVPEAATAVQTAAVIGDWDGADRVADRSHDSESWTSRTGSWSSGGTGDRGDRRGWGRDRDCHR